MALKYCSNCHDKKPIEGFVSMLNKPTKYCGDCLEKSRARDATRPKRDFKVYEARKHVKERRKQWTDDHPDKTKGYYTDYRKRKRAENEAEYLAHNAEIALNWRENNPEKHQIILENARKSVTIKLTTYKRSAAEKGFCWELTDEEAEILFQANCYYCDEMDPRGLCGIDRVDSTIGYTPQNTKPCCKMCNYMKCNHTIPDFLTYCKNIHIQTQNPAEISEPTAPLIFNTNILGYEARAHKKELVFELTEKQFKTITATNCYLCNQKNYSLPNGIDRMDNNEGYTTTNAKPCCRICNYMKKDFELQEFIQKCSKVYNHNRKFVSPWQINSTHQTNK